MIQEPKEPIMTRGVLKLPRFRSLTVGENDMQTEPIILAAEDDEWHYYLLKQQLKRVGIDWPIQRFSDGQQAMDFFRDQFIQTCTGPAILLLDLRLPKISGPEILARIRASDLPSLRELPVIVITSSCNPDDRAQCIRLGCTAYLTKPFAAADLHSAIHAALSGTPVGQTS
jgi:CheY-like chemotaxis protein